MIDLRMGQAETILPTMDERFDVIVISPPYNFNKNYRSYDDNLNYDDYLKKIDLWLSLIRDRLKDHGSFFLNIGHKPSHLTLPYDVLNIALSYFHLQNNIIWVKSISIDNDTKGHYKPINSERFLNDLWEHVFHLTLTKDVKLDRLSIGCPYKDQTNIKRWSGNSVRCQGNVWFIPYETVSSKKTHPAAFPLNVPLNCLKLAGCNEDSIVLDPFIGSGTTALACKEIGCRCIGIDIDEAYLEQTKERVSWNG